MEDALLLQKIGEMIDGVRTEIGELRQGQERLESRIDAIELGQERLERDLHETRIIVESLPKQIQLIAEQHTDIIENQKNVEDYTETKSRVSTLEHVVQAHTKEITELKQAAV